VAVLALALGAYGLYTGMRAQGDATAARADAAALRTRVDSLQRLMPPDTAGRVPVTATDTGAKAAAAALPPPPPAPAAPRTNPNHR
jgi:hypothetical protein